MNAVAARLAAQYPDTNREYAHYVVTSWLDAVTREVRPVLLMLIGAAAFTLCVACANVANLLLARASTRRREIAVRTALGAGRRRILRQLLTESLLLAAIGGLAGLVLALVATRYIVAALPNDFPRAGEIAPNAEVLGFTLLVTMLTSCVFGVAPGWRSAQTKVSPLLNDASTGISDTPAGRRARNVLVVTEIVLAFVLLAGACFFISNLMRLRAAPLGFDPQGVATAYLAFPDAGEADAGLRVVRFFDEVLARVSQIDGVASASVVSRLPLSGDRTITDFEITGRPMAPPDRPMAQPHIVAPGYFETMRIPVLHGRDFNRTDARDAQQVAIINSTLAERLFPGQDPVGQRITPVMFIDTAGPAEREIVGVVGDVRSDMLAAEQPLQVYVPLAQCAWREVTLVMRATESIDDLVPEISAIVSQLNDNVPVAAPGVLSERVTGGIATPRLKSILLATFAAMASVLTAIGVYGVMAYSVAQRRHEIGIRLALGAPERTIFRLILTEGMRLTACGLFFGAAIAALMLPMLQKLAPQGAFELRARDLTHGRAAGLGRAGSLLDSGAVGGTTATARCPRRATLDLHVRASRGGGRRLIAQRASTRRRA